MAKKTNGSTALARWDEKLSILAKQSKKAVANIGSGGNFISCKGGNLAYQGQIIPGNKMTVVVIDWVLENQAYVSGFSDDNPQSPYCYAFGRSKEEMAPNPEHVETPVNATCEGCPNNQWGSAETGRGKACAEVARLAIVSEADFKELESAQEAYLKVPVTSMKFWAGYVRELEQTYHRPPLAFQTEIALIPQAALPGWHMEFKLVEAIEDEQALEAIIGLNEKISAKIAFPYPKFEEAPATPAPKKAKPAARPAARPATPARPVAPVVAARAGGVAPAVKGQGKAPKF